MRDSSNNQFKGGMSQDINHREVAAGDWLDSMGMLNRGVGEEGAITPIPGTVKRFKGLPAGQNLVIGTVEDKQNLSVIYLVHNTSNNHSIIRYYYQTGVIRTVIQTPQLGFTPNRKIHDLFVLDGRWLGWTDGVHNGDGIDGGTPKLLDMEYAVLEEKQLEYILYFLRGPAKVTVNGYLVQFRVETFGGAMIEDWTTAYSPTISDTVEDVMDGIADQLNASTAFQCSAVNKKTHLEITMDSTDRRLLVRFMNGNVSPAEPIDEWLFFLRPTNHYYWSPGIGYIADHFKLATAWPWRSPEPRLQATTDLVNTLFGKFHQFRYRYIYYDNRASAWSPISYAATNMNNLMGLPYDGVYRIEPNREYNVMTILLNDPEILLNQEWAGMVTRIEVCYRHSNEEAFYSIGRFEPWEFASYWGGYPNHMNYMRRLFTGTEPRYAVASDDISSPDIQVLKNFDWVPTKCLGMGVTSDEQGATRLALAGQEYDFEMPIISGDIEIIWEDIALFNTSEFQYNLKHLKKGGEYDILIQYYDQHGKSPGAKKIGRIKIPFDDGTNAPDGYQGKHRSFPWLRIVMKNDPPEWGFTFRIAVTDNLNQAIYLQTPLIKDEYIKLDGESSYDVVNSNEDWTHMMVSGGLEGFLAYQSDNPDPPADTSVTVFGNINDGRVWSAEAGDYIRVVSWISPTNTDRGKLVGLRDPSNPWDSGPTTVVNNLIDEYIFPIAGYIYTDSTLYLLVERRDDLLDIGSFNDGAGRACIIEAFRIRDGSVSIHETTCYGRIIDGQHVQMRREDESGLLEVNTFELKDGDTSYGTVNLDQFNGTLGANITYWNWYFEMPSPYRFNLKPAYHGRATANAFDLVDYLFQRIHVSDPYIPATEINGISSVRGGNFIDVNRDFGPIMSLKSVRDDIVAICYSRVQPIYVGKGRMMELSGQEQVGRSTNLLTLARPMLQLWGCQNPEAILVNDNHIYAPDRRSGLWWRYSNDGLNDIGGKNRVYWRQKFKDLDSPNTQSLFIYTGWEYQTQSLYVTISAHTQGNDRLPGETLVFCEADNEWKGHMPFVPEHYSTAGPKMVGFLAGQAYTHLDGDVMSFYETQYIPWIQFVVNAKPRTMKVFQCGRIQSKYKWRVTDIQIPASGYLPNGMQSLVPDGKIVNHEGMWWFDFLRDKTDPAARFQLIADTAIRQVRALNTGRFLRGEVMVVTLTGDTPTDINDLYEFITDFTPSMNTK